jgi:hypothetical protein
MYLGLEVDSQDSLTGEQSAVAYANDTIAFLSPTKNLPKLKGFVRGNIFFGSSHYAALMWYRTICSDVY